MKYQDGKDVLIGDIVNLGAGERAVVVCIIDDNVAGEGYKLSDWAYLERGVVFRSEKCGDTYFIKPDEDTELVRRQAE